MTMTKPRLDDVFLYLLAGFLPTGAAGFGLMVAGLWWEPAWLPGLALVAGACLTILPLCWRYRSAW